MTDLKDIFDKLPSPRSIKENAYSAKTIKGYKNHRIAKDKGGNPSLLIYVSEEKQEFLIASQHLFNIKVWHNVSCEIESGKKVKQSKFTVVSYIGQNEEIKKLFLNTCQVLTNSLGQSPTNKKIEHVVNKFIELFKAIKEIPRKSVQGLWCELFLIEQSVVPEILIEGWHSIPEERFDFSFKKLRLEVKSSIKDSREHYFSADQLFSTKNIEIMIVSIQVDSNVSGLSINDLLGRINLNLKEYPKQKEKLHLLVFSTLGAEIEKANQVKFDYEHAKESIRFYKSEHIPKINKEAIPKEVTNVKFVSNLFNTKSLDYNIDELLDEYIANN